MKCGAVLPYDHNIVCQLMSGHDGDHYSNDGTTEWTWTSTPDESKYPAEDRVLESLSIPAPEGLQTADGDAAPAYHFADNPWPALLTALIEATDRARADATTFDARVGYWMLRGVLRYLRWTFT